jgi:hypothetical protein
MPLTRSSVRIAAIPSATASYKVSAVTSTVCRIPFISSIVTLQERTEFAPFYQITFRAN